MRKTYCLLLCEWCCALGLCFLLLWGGPWAPLAASGFPLAHVHSMGLHIGLAIGCLVGALFRPLGTLFRPLGTLPRFSTVLLCGATGITGFAIPAFFERFDGQIGPALVTVSGAALTGFALALVLGCAMRDLLLVPAPRRKIVFLASAAAGLVVFAVLFYLVDANSLLLIACFELFPLALLFLYLTPSSREGAAWENAPLSGVGAPAVCVFLLGLESVVVMQVGYVVQVYQVGIALAAGAFLALVWLVLKKPVTVVGVYFIAFPLLATCLLAFPFLGDAAQGAVIFVSNVVATVLLAVVLAGSAAGRGDSSAMSPRLSLLLLGVFHVSVLAGFAFGLVCREVFGEQPVWVLAAAFVCLYALSVCAFVLLLRRRRRPAGADDTAGVNAVAADAGADAADAAASVDSITELCALATARFGLSEREAQVLDLVMRGRDAPTVAKMLFISQNTVRFHMKNLYQAADVHGKQELIDAVEHLRGA